MNSDAQHHVQGRKSQELLLILRHPIRFALWELIDEQRAGCTFAAWVIEDSVGV